MLIANVENGQIIKVLDCRDVFGRVIPNDEQLANRGYMRVNLWRDHDRLTQKLVPCDPVIEGNWVYMMKVEQMTAEEIQSAKDSAMAQIRADRNRLLSDSDYTQVSDNPNPKKAEWATYRQTLRDLPANVTGDPRTFTDWPKNPDWKPLEN